MGTWESMDIMVNKYKSDFLEKKLFLDTIDNNELII